MLSNTFELSISHFTPVAARSESFTTSDFLLSLSPLRNQLSAIVLHDLHLHASPPLEFDDEDEDSRPESIVFDNMQNATCINQIMDFLGDPDDLHIARCCPVLLTPFEGKLTLSLIDRGEDIEEHLRMFRGENLTIDDCPGFNDDVLNAMTEPRFVSGVSNSCAPFVRHLTIHDCPNISLPALKQFVKRKCYDGRQKQYPTMLGLELTGRVVELSPEDQDWFKRWQITFFYNPF
jgi:hypothetical protein